MWAFLVVPGLDSDIEGEKKQDAWSVWMVMVGREGEKGRASQRAISIREDGSDEVYGTSR